MSKKKVLRPELMGDSWNRQITGALCALLISAELFAAIPALDEVALARQARQVSIAAASGQLAPVITRHTPLTDQQAYAIQTAAVKLRLEESTPLGFKAGLTSPGSQKKFAVDGPVAGVLLAGGERLQGTAAKASLANFNQMMLEAELGFIVSKTISKPLSSVEQLRSVIAEVVPVIELPDLGFDYPAALTGVDIVANNVAAKQFVYGAGMPVGTQDFNALVVSIYKGDELVVKGRGQDAMGDQWQTLLWLVNRTLASGWQIEPGQILITGALGKMIKASPGHYRFDFAALGELRLNVE